ncbi:MAG: NAD(P)H-hydrate epimerase [Candidatus Nanohalobium sp.]
MKVSGSEMREMDRKAIEEYGIDASKLMENAGFRIADFMIEKFEREDSICVFTGKGNNGGDALVAARNLSNHGFDVSVVLAEEPENLCRGELETLREMDFDTHGPEDVPDFEVALDGLLGYSIEGDPRPPYDDLIEKVNSAEKVVSVDIPTGVNPSGEVSESSVEPDYTVTLAAPFIGMNQENSGDIIVADISIPREVYEEENVDYPFKDRCLVEIN